MAQKSSSSHCRIILLKIWVIVGKVYFQTLQRGHKCCSTSLGLESMGFELYFQLFCYQLKSVLILFFHLPKEMACCKYYCTKHLETQSSKLMLNDANRQIPPSTLTRCYQILLVLWNKQNMACLINIYNLFSVTKQVIVQ